MPGSRVDLVAVVRAMPGGLGPEAVDQFHGDVVLIAPEREDGALEQAGDVDRPGRPAGNRATGSLGESVERYGGQVGTDGRQVVGVGAGEAEPDHGDPGAGLLPGQLADDGPNIPQALVLVHRRPPLEGGGLCHLGDRSLSEEVVDHHGVEAVLGEPGGDRVVERRGAVYVRQYEAGAFRLRAAVTPGGDLRAIGGREGQALRGGGSARRLPGLVAHIYGSSVASLRGQGATGRRGGPAGGEGGAGYSGPDAERPRTGRPMPAF